MVALLRRIAEDAMTGRLDRRTFTLSAVATATVSMFASRAPTAARSPSATHGFGWLKDRPDRRDRLLAAPFSTNLAPRPAAKDVSSALPPAYDQGELGSCTANAIAAAVQYARRLHQKPVDFIPSRLFIYYLERKAAGMIYVDAGAQLRDGISAVVANGVPPEQQWDYDGIAGDPTTHLFPKSARAIIEPPSSIMAEAARYKTISYAPLNQDVQALESCIAAGYPFVFGFVVYSNFSDRTKLLKAPGSADQITPYGHAVLVTGYD